MNSRVLPLLAGAIALSIGSALPAFAQSTTPTAPTPSYRKGGRLDFLNLTPDQQARIQQIRQNTRTQIENILTAEQKAQLQRERENRGTSPAEGGQKKRGWGFESLNLTAQQRTQIDALKQSSKAQIEAVLTPQQRQQLEQRRPNRRKALIL
jgi:Spy/CpxP family protein refolding chaperone